MTAGWERLQLAVTLSSAAETGRKQRPTAAVNRGEVIQDGRCVGGGVHVSLALETMADWIILDDLPARRLAKERGFITAVRPSLDALRARGFRLRKEVYEDVLNAAGVGQA